MPSYPLPAEIRLLDKLTDTCDVREAIYVGAAGFEARAPRTLEALAEAGVHAKGAAIIRYTKRDAQNETNYEKMMALASTLCSSNNICPTEDEDLSGIGSLIAGMTERGTASSVLVDVSAMSHDVLLRALHWLGKLGLRLVILYTEAGAYRPFLGDKVTVGTKSMTIEQVLTKLDTETAFFLLSASEYEDEPFVTTGGYEAYSPAEMIGRISVQASTTVVAFPTFKRLRTSTAVAQVEARRRHFLFGLPPRCDLEWRNKLLRIVNHDLVEPTDYEIDCSTLSPHDTFGELRRAFEPQGHSAPTNQIVIALGSKMQTIAVWHYVATHPWVRVILTYPREFHPTRYSEGWGDTFVFDTAQPWPTP